jgi:cellulose synthase/poly-beta-1,6-N-acetylglucosamine synthase-like glycosyltransferase
MGRRSISSKGERRPKTTLQQQAHRDVDPALYLLLILPFLSATISWLYFPRLAEWLSLHVLGYEPGIEVANWLWLTLIFGYYTWFTYLSIAVAGSFTIVAWLSRRKASGRKLTFYPMVSFIVPGFNEARLLPKCIKSLYNCANSYLGQVEIIVVDDGSDDYTYETALATFRLHSRQFPKVRGRTIRHSANLGKVEALRTGVNCARGEVIALVDADSWWNAESLTRLVEYMYANGKAAVTGYVHPESGARNPLLILQQLEYSQSLAVFRCAQALSNTVLVIPGALGLIKGNILRHILNSKSMRSVTEDLEITLEMHSRGCTVGYLNTGRSATVAPTSIRSLWKQRTRWLTGWLHNTLDIHGNLIRNKSRSGLLLLLCLLLEYVGAFVEFSAICLFPALFAFAPDHGLFLLNLLWFGAYSIAISIVLQAIALRFAYGGRRYDRLLWYTPFYALLRFVTLLARMISTLRYALGERGRWENSDDA